MFLMNIQIYKTKNRFSITHHTSNNFISKLPFFYQEIEEKFYFSHVKTKQDFVPFTFKHTSSLNTLTSSLISFSVVDSLYSFKNSVNFKYNASFYNKFVFSKKNIITTKESSFLKIYFTGLSSYIFPKNSNINANGVENAFDFLVDSNNHLIGNIYLKHPEKDINNVFSNLTRKNNYRFLFYNFLFKKNTAEFFKYYTHSSQNNSLQYNNSFYYNNEQYANKRNFSNQDVTHFKFWSEYIPVKKRKYLVRRKRWKRFFSERETKKLTKFTKLGKVYRFNTRQSYRKNIFQISRLLTGFRSGHAFNESIGKIPTKTDKLKSIFFKKINRYSSLQQSINNSSSFTNVFSNKRFPYINSVNTKKIRRVIIKQNGPAFEEKVRFHRKNLNYTKAYTHNSALIRQSRQTQLLQKKTSSAHINTNNLQNILKRRVGTQVSLYRINALSLTRFSFNWALKEKEFLIKKRKKEIPNRTWEEYISFLHQKRAIKATNFSLNNLVSKTVLNHFSRVNTSPLNQNKFRNKKSVKNSSLFRKALEKERTRQYRYTAVYMKDLLRLSFVAFYYKHAQLIIEFAAFVLKKLPRNRKETKFLRFIIKLRKVFSAQRKEIIGLRVRFQGRVNRWRRTKHIVGHKGVQPLHSYDTYIAFGRAQAITRKGAFGRRLWIVYRAFFVSTYSINFINYKNAAKQINWATI